MAVELPKISIVIPYKVDRGYLRQAEQSIREQQYNGEIQVIHAQSNHGVAYNLNRGIEQATGEYVKYLCDDDMLTPYSLLHSVSAIHGCDFIHGCAINFWADGREQIYRPTNTSPSLKEMAQRNVMHGGTLMYRRDVFDRIGLFDESLDCAEEYEFNMRCLQAGMKLGYTNSYLYRYRRHPQQKSLGANVDQQIRAKKIQQIQQRYANT